MQDYLLKEETRTKATSDEAPPPANEESGETDADDETPEIKVSYIWSSQQLLVSYFLGSSIHFDMIVFGNSLRHRQLIIDFLLQIKADTALPDI